MFEIIGQLQQLLLHTVLLAQAYGEGKYGQLAYGSSESISVGPFNLPLPNTGQGMLFWGGALLLALATAFFAWRFHRKRKAAKVTATAESSDQLLKY